MLNFTYAISTRIIFGRHSIEQLSAELRPHGNNILLVYGSGSIKKNGIYDAVTNTLMRNSFQFHELPGVQPNPRITSVRHGIQLCRDHDIDCILAVGGGSVIDCAKTIAAGVFSKEDPWELFLKGDAAIKQALPIGTILTFAGTGSEMNGNAVLSNDDPLQKLAIHNDVLRPKFSLLDPTYTFTVPKDQTAAGTVDIFSHVLEQYFSLTTEAYLQDRLAESLLKTCVFYGPHALKEPENYEARAQLMWSSSLALNGLLGYGKISDWATHGIEHAVSAMYDVTHGAGLAILTPHWMRYVLDTKTVYKYVDYAKNVWGIRGTNNLTMAKKAIEKTQNFFKELGMPTRLRDVGVQQSSLSELAQKTIFKGPVGKFRKLEKHDIETILQRAF